MTLTTVAEGLEFPEGPIALDDGSVLLVEIKRGTLTRVAPDGKTSVVAETGGGPNGADGSRVYVAETITGRLWWWDIAEPGRVRPNPDSWAPHGGTLLHGFPGLQWLDSLAVDAEDNVCVATLYSGRVSVVSPDGELLETVPVPDEDIFVTNICFGGPDLRTAYITSSGHGILYSIPWPRPGLRLNHTA